MSWLLIPLVLSVVIFVGAMVVSGKWPRANPARDAKAIARWTEARRLGFWLFVVRGPVLFFLLYFTTGTLTRNWRTSTSLVLSMDDVLWILLLSLPMGLVIGRMQWSALDSSASEAEARQRESQNKQEPNQPPEPTSGLAPGRGSS